MLTDYNELLARQDREDLLREAGKWRLQRELRASREQRQGRGARAALEQRYGTLARSTKALVSSLLGRRRTSHGGTRL